MTAARKLDVLFVEAAEASARVLEEREEACRKAVVAVREVERRIQEAIAGDTLRGLARIAGQLDPYPFQGARVVTEGAPYGVDAPIRPGRSALVFDKDGRLVCVEVQDGQTYVVEPLQDQDIMARDLEAVLWTANVILTRHCERAEKTTATYTRALELATSLGEVLAR